MVTENKVRGQKYNDLLHMLRWYQDDLRAQAADARKLLQSTAEPHWFAYAAWERELHTRIRVVEGQMQELVTEIRRQSGAHHE